jgi:sigma-E factor negative regulatory protein RseA
MNTLPPEDDLQADRAALSAAMDGDADQTDAACRAWRGDARARADWHAYHLIGDVLRSDDARCDAAQDAAFLARLRKSLGDEPAVLAPRPLAQTAPLAAPAIARARRARRWMVPTAAAAGVAAVAAALVVTRVGAPESAAPALAVSTPPVGGGPVPVALQAPSTQALPTEGAAMIRSPELDRYLAAHRQYANTSALTTPAGVVRSATVAAPGR